MDDPQKPTDERDPVPFAIVEALAKNIRELRELEQRKAILYLEWLATQLENNSVGSPDTIDRKETPCTEV